MVWPVSSDKWKVSSVSSRECLVALAVLHWRVSSTCYYDLRELKQLRTVTSCRLLCLEKYEHNK